MPIILKTVLTMTLGLCALSSAGPLEKDFASPPDSARMWTWWFWLGDKVDEKSITADLEALKTQGMAGVTIYSISGPGVEGNGPDYMSPEWRALFRHTLKEADRLGLGVSAMLCSGWNAGGPWIKPEQACKQHVHSELLVTGPQHFKDKLPMPAADPQLYRDVAILAFSEDQPERKLPPAALMDLKNLRNAVNGQAPTKEINEAPRQPLPPAEAGAAIDPAAVIDLTSRLNADGVLDWEVPAGNWRILRTGYTLTGAKTTWSSPSGLGFDSDPMDAMAMDFHFANVGAPLIKEAGPLAGRVFRSVQIDSWEINHPNWTAAFLEGFRKFRGYDPLPYLPALAGHLVGSTGVTERFLYDYRKTVADMVAENYFGRLSTLAEAGGIIQQSEAGGLCYPKSMALDCLKNLGRCAIPMGEFWQHGDWIEGNQNKNGKQTASAAHLYGKPIAAAEAFTSGLHWQDSPATLKPTADRAFCEGFNHFFIFSSATRSEDGFPGTEFCAGTHFNRKITWWNEARCFSDYVARCSHLLQQGLFVADVLFYNGDAAPNFVPPKHVDPSVGPGYDYDVCNSEIILTRLAVKDGRIVLPDGMSYRLLVLPESATMPVEIIAKLKELVAAGMTLVGPRPDMAPGLKDYPECDRQVKTMAAELWGDCNGTTIKEHAFGKGRVVWGKTVRELLDDAGVKPDFSYANAQPDTFLDWIHRNINGTDIYFIVNRMNRPEKADCTFRVGGKQPELWDPVTGGQRDLPQFDVKDGCTTVPLEFGPYGSMFVVFQKEIRTPAADSRNDAAANFLNFKTLKEIPGPWTVRFAPEWFYPVDGLEGEMAQGTFVFEKLEDWTQRPEPAIRHFSGTALYRQVFDLAPENGISQAPASAHPRRLFLDLGSVKELARVRLNGTDLGVVWCEPWRLEISAAVKPGANTLEIEVTNLWPNRLVGDNPLPAALRRTQTNIAVDPKQALLPSGLLGPVRVLEQARD